MEMHKKRFIPKNKLLQYDLDAFLYWRFQTSSSYSSSPTTEAHKENNTQTPITRVGRRLLVGKKAKKSQSSVQFLLSKTPSNPKLKPFLPFNHFGSSTQTNHFNGQGVENAAPFFPEKKNFMQFWALPLLGASFLSFLTFENRGFSKPAIEGNLKKSEILKESNFQKTLPSPLNQTFKEYSTLPKKFYISDMPLISSSSSFAPPRAERSLTSSSNHSRITDKETKQLSETKFYTQEIQKLCLFYLNLTEEKLLSTLDLPKRENFSQMYAFLEIKENLWLKSLYLQNSFFHWNYYPLYDPAFISSLPFQSIGFPLLKQAKRALLATLEAPSPSARHSIFLQKLNPGLSLCIYGSRTEDAEKFFEQWTKNPTLSYLKSTQFFENWLLQLQAFQTMSQNLNPVSNVAVESSKKLFLEKAKETLFTELQQKSQTIDFFHKFLQKFNQSQITWMQAYQTLKDNKPLNTSQGISKMMSKQFLESFEKKYKHSSYQLAFQRKYLIMLQKQRQKTHYLEKEFEKQKFKTVLKNRLNRSLFQKRLESKIDVFVSKQPASFQMPEHKENLKPSLRNFLYDLFLLKDLNMNMSLSKANEKRSSIIIDTDTPHQKVNTEILKNPEKWLQEIQLYSQLQKIQKIFVQKLKNTKENTQVSSISKRSHLSFSTKEKPKNSQNHFARLAGRAYSSLPSEASRAKLEARSARAKLSEPRFASESSDYAPVRASEIEPANEEVQSGPHSNSMRFFDPSAPWKLFLTEKTFFSVPLEVVASRLEDSVNSKAWEKPKRFKANMRLFGNHRKKAFFTQRLIKKTKAFVMKDQFQKQNFQNNFVSVYSTQTNSLALRSARSDRAKREARYSLLLGDCRPLGSSEASGEPSPSGARAKLAREARRSPQGPERGIEAAQPFPNKVRSSEKLFRSYLSIKNVKGLQNKKPADFFLRMQNSTSQKTPSDVYRILRQLKQNAIFSNSRSDFNWVESKKLSIENLEDSLDSPKSSTLLRASVARSERSDQKESKAASEAKSASKARSESLAYSYARASRAKRSLGLPRGMADSSNIPSENSTISFNQFVSKNSKNNPLEFRKLQDFLFLKKANFLNNSTDVNASEQLKIFEKKKSLEKRRRLKKLKLENRRRKKRKRFYPRPQILRFQCYLNFLQKRHANEPQNLNHIPFSENLKGNRNKVNILKGSSSGASSAQGGRLGKYPFAKLATVSFKDTVDHSRGAESFLSKPLSEIPHKTEFYKISNQTLTEFERLCWKSYWLRSNLKPYVLKIQKSLRRIKEVENFKSNQHVPTFLEFLHKSKHSSFLKTTPAYVNPLKLLASLAARENLQSFQTSFISPFDSFAIKAEYERLLYERMNDEIKNVKSQLTVDGQSQARSYKTGRQKLEKNLAKPFWNPFFEFSNNYLEPNLDTATSILNAPFLKTDFAKKDFPTLRLLWACQKSQLFTYQSNNWAQNLWTTYKIREQTKNNKTRKFFYRLSRKLTDFKDWVHISALEKSKAELSPFSSEARSAIRAASSYASARGEEQVTKKQKFNLNSLNRYEDKKLQYLSTFKTNRANQKMQTFGGFVSGKNYQTYLKHLKFQLQQHPVSKKELFTTQNQKSSIQRFNNVDPLVETNFQNPIQKRQFHFWWSTQKPSFPFMLSFLFSKSENASFYLNAMPAHFNFPTDVNSQGVVAFERGAFASLRARSSSEARAQSSSFAQLGKQEFISQTFWLCACVLHLGIFFALIRLPEIRSLIKFQVLIFSKVCNIYLFGIFALYDLLKSYAMKIKQLIQNVLKLSTSNFQSLEQSQISGFQYSATRKLSSKFFQPQNKLNKTSTQGSLLPKGSLRAQSSHPSSLSWMHSTVHWKFFYKSFFYAENEENRSSNVRLISMGSISPMFGKTERMNRSSLAPGSLASLASLASSFGEKVDVTAEQDLSLFLKGKANPDRTSLKFYHSWSTGFVWKMVLKNFTKPNLRLESRSNKINRVLDKRVSSHKRQQSKQISSEREAPLADRSARSRFSRNHTFSYSLESNIQIQTFLTLGVLWGTRFCFSVLYLCLNVFYKIVFQLIDLLEGTLLIFYKFLEKPAEVLVDWIAEVFLVEWTSDIHTYVPEAFDTAIWNSTTKFSRSTRFFYGFPFGFVVQRFFLESTQLFYQWLLKPESDLRIRQKKGIIFWDIWSEILIQAAEKYKMNLSSLSTVKEEQELLMENLVEQKWTASFARAQSSPLSLLATLAEPSPSRDRYAPKGALNTKLEKGSVVSFASVAAQSASVARSESGARRDRFAPQVDETKIDRSNSKMKLSKNKTKTNFVDQEFQPSLIKLEPLMKFIQNAPRFYQPVKTDASMFPLTFVKNEIFSEKFFEQLPVRNGVHANFLNFQFTTKSGEKKEQFVEIFSENFKETSLKRWSTTQYLNTQGKDTDLFMDIHPPKSFAHVSFLKSYLPAQEILGSLVCEIYSGLFSSKVSKNVLIVGAPGMAKSFFIQALAGETELKIVLDNAHRYAFVNGGVPVGMKLLREVFDSMALHTPCLFLLEDVHVIGERRPMLISDDETSKTKEFAFGAEQEEVHEKNKLVYQLSKHALSHYKKPYKGDFSLAIPTNHFCYDLFLGVSPPRKRRADLTASSPLPIQALDSALDPSHITNHARTSGQSLSQGSSCETSTTRDGLNLSANNSGQTLLSSLQISVAQVFAPPATSPFHVLLMKEQKKLKPKKLVKDVPWSGLSYDQWMLLSKSNYSVRIKVALLAETAMKNLSVKLDMITDLLVIIDSVRSNRGFVVFATTHLPALLDPALRRPGRLDETISLPLLPNIQTRFEIFKTRLSSYTQSMDFFDWSLYSGQLKQNENQLANFLDKNILALFNSKHPIQSNPQVFNQESSSLFVLQRFYDYPISSLSQAFQSSLSLQSLWTNVHQFKKMLSMPSSYGIALFPPGPRASLASRAKRAKQRTDREVSEITDKVLQNSHSFFAGQTKRNYIALSYAQTGQFLTEALLLKEQQTYMTKFVGNAGRFAGKEFSRVDNQKFMYQSLYASTFETKQTLFKLLASKISEFFVFQIFCPALSSSTFNPQLLKFEKPRDDFYFSYLNRARAGAELASRAEGEGSPLRSEPSGELRSARRSGSACESFAGLRVSDSLPSNMFQYGMAFNNLQNSVNNWQSATSFLDSIFQKRYLYNKNSIVLKMLFFEDKISLGEPPSPPNSSILNPARKFENYQKTLRDFMQKPGLTINEKLQMHQKQRFLKLLYNIPQPTTSRAKAENSGNKLGSSFTNGSVESLSVSPENFSASFKELGYLDLVTLRPSSTYGFYKNRLFHRQCFSFLNQWWNGQLAEHNAETTYLSHIDWRSMFVKSLGDVFLDFPDAEQYYNPRNRRWFLQSKTWSYWLNFENMREQISEHFLMECFTQISELLHSNRELTDYLAYRFLRNHQLHELDLLQVLVRFYKKKDINT